MSEKDTPLKSRRAISTKRYSSPLQSSFFFWSRSPPFSPDVADKNFKLLQQQIFTNASWFYILAVALILLSVTFLGAFPLRRHQTWPRSCATRFSLPLMVCHAVFSGDGHRPDVLRRGRTGYALSLATGRHARERRGGQTGHAPDLFPLGAARLGDLRHRGVDSGLLQLSAWPAVDSALCALSDHRRTYLWPYRPCRRYLRRHRHRIRGRNLAGLWRVAGQRRA